MGVHSFWDIVGPTARPVRLESLQDKRMAVDASIWIYQFLKAVRDDRGNSVKNAHVVGFFRRICKLVYLGINPVFVFDGGVPALKKDTIRLRKERREGKRDDAAKTARKLLAIQMQNLANGKQDSAKKESSADAVQNFAKQYQDEWTLPELSEFKVNDTDNRVMATEKYEEALSQLNEEEWENLDLEKINPASKEFEELPKATQYMILTTLRLKSRLRLGYSKEQLEGIFPNSMDFSKFQIDQVKRRNFFTQKLLNTTGAHDGGASKFQDIELQNRIAGKMDRKYALTKTEHGWGLGFGGIDGSDSSKAIALVDDGSLGKPSDYNYARKKRDSSKIDVESESEEDFVEWEDVDTKPKPAEVIQDYSIQAARLPKPAVHDQKVGGQSFLDKRTDEWISPIKKAVNSKVIHVNDLDDYDDDDYKTHLNEMQAMEEYKRNRDQSIKKNIASKPIVTEIENNTKIIANEARVPPAQKKNLAPALTEAQQNLNMIIDKIPGLENESFGDSILFSNVSVSHEEPQDVAHETTKPAQENPTWFQNNDTTKSNPYGIVGFVADKTENANSNDAVNQNKNYELLTGYQANEYFDAQKSSDLGNLQMKKENTKLNTIVLDSDSEAENEKSSNLLDGDASTKIDANQEGDIEIVEKPKILDKHNDKEILEPIAETIDTVNEESNRKGNEEANSESLSKNNENADLNVEKDRTLNTQPVVYDYDFEEDEENDIVESMRREEQVFDMFKSDLNSNIARKAFVEDELYQQQARDKRDSDEVTPDMVIAVQELLTRFGVPYIIAPMEAEAQCAELLHLKLVDGIITDDSDVFLFGGSKVYKNMFQEKNYVEYYDDKSILEVLGLDRNNLIELAQLLGSDYTNGIKGLGPVSSMEVLADFGNLTKFKEWYNKGQFDLNIQEKASKFEKELRKKLVKNAVILDEDFPSALVRDAYMNPDVNHDKTPFVWGKPDLDMLRDFLRKQLGWPQEKSDEILVPLIRDINKRYKKGKQRTLTEFFPSEYIREDKHLNLGKRILTATGKMKQRRLK